MNTCVNNKQETMIHYTLVEVHNAELHEKHIEENTNNSALIKNVRMLMKHEIDDGWKNLMVYMDSSDSRSWEEAQGNQGDYNFGACYDVLNDLDHITTGN